MGSAIAARPSCGRWLGVGAALALGLIPAGAAAAPVVVLQGLDKVTARVSTMAAPLDTEIDFGTLGIVARACHKAPPEEPPESTAFLEIFEYAPDHPPRDLFIGWMFASSPGLSALEHPVYDVWVLDCRDDQPVEATEDGAPVPTAEPAIEPAQP
ncbi:MAG: DUF2155 domain-containing protein [Alphaproteobacteria bacterium]